MADKPTPIDTTSVDQINKNLDEIYNSLEWWRRYLGFDGNIPRIYYHGGDRIEELIARLRGEIAFIAKQLQNLTTEVKGIEDKFNDLLAYIDTEIANQIEALMPTILDELVERLQPELEKIVQTSEANAFGMPKMNDAIYGSANATDKLSLANFITPHTARNTVLQNIYVSAQAGEVYTIQSDDKSPEGFVLTRLDMAGNQLSELYIVGAGHGSETFFIENSLGRPDLYFWYNNKYYYTHIPDTDVTLNTADLLSKIIVANEPGGVGEYSESTDGTGVFINLDRTQTTALLYARTLKYNPADGTFNNEGATTQLDVSTLVGWGTADNVMQGYEVVPKQAVTGSASDTNKFIILVMAGKSGLPTTLQTWEYDTQTNKITYLKPIEHMEQMFSSNRFEQIEAEGIASVKMAQGSSGYVYGLVFGWSGGISLKHESSLVMSGNGLVLSTLAGASNGAVDPTYAAYDYESPQYLYQLLDMPQYQLLPGAEMPKYLDVPRRWRGVSGDNEWFLYNSKPNKHGDIVQTLERRGYGSPMERYTRSINYSASNYGADRRNATAIGPWNVEPLEARGATFINSETKISQLDQFHTDYYVQATANIDWEGLPPQTGWHIHNIPMGTARTSFMQIATSYSSTVTPEVRTRIVTGTSDTYGPNLDWSQAVTLSDWTTTNGKLNFAGFTPTAAGWSGVSGSIRYRNGVGQLEFTGTASAVPSTDEFQLGTISVSNIRPAGTMAAYGVIIDVTSGTSGSLRVAPDGSVYVNMGYSPSMAVNDYFTGSVTWQYN